MFFLKKLSKLQIMDSILLQKQVKDNAGDLEKEFLSMQNWQKEVTEKDKRLKEAVHKPTPIPGIRKKKYQFLIY